MEGSNIIVDTIDLRRGCIGSLGLFAGFLASCFYSIWVCIGGCQKFSAEKSLIRDLYTFISQQHLSPILIMTLKIKQKLMSICNNKSKQPFVIRSTTLFPVLNMYL